MIADVQSKPRALRRVKGYTYVFLLCSIVVCMAMLDNKFLGKEMEAARRMSEEARLSKIPRAPPARGDAPAQVISILTDGETTKHGDGAAKKHGSAAAKTFGFDPADSLIMFKTGATRMWSRAPMHLATSLANKTLTPNVVFYSDDAGSIGGHEVVDALANASATLKASPDFELRNAMQRAHERNRYVDGEEDEHVWVLGGWRIDKYKFLPLVAHAAANYPDRKWYIYMEDDTFYFWEDLYAWLASFDPDDSVFVGGPAQRLGDDFAHGGSGFALSRGAMKKSFGSDPELATKWDEYSLEHGCGDHILAHVLATKGVERWRGFDNSNDMPLQGRPTWQMPFGQWHWCSPLFSVHKLNPSDVSRLHEWRATKRGPVRYKDLFTDLIRPHLVARRDEWNNFAEVKHFTSMEEKDGGQTLSEAERRTKPWYSADACAQACRDWKICLSWRYADDNCYLDDSAKQGLGVDMPIRMTSGWMMERIDRLEEEVTCDALPWWQ